jgi:hypothetical protein
MTKAWKVGWPVDHLDDGDAVRGDLNPARGAALMQGLNTRKL